MTEKDYKPGESGTCGFCLTGEGWLGDQGDESSQYLHSYVKTVDESGEVMYAPHPNAHPDREGAGPGQSITWCGNCLGGLAHKFQRESDHNLRAEHTALSLWMEMDGLRWSTWNSQTPEEEVAFKKTRDDPAVHLDKLQRERRVNDVQNELSRRAGFDLTTKGWRD